MGVVVFSGAAKPAPLLFHASWGLRVARQCRCKHLVGIGKHYACI